MTIPTKKGSRDLWVILLPPAALYVILLAFSVLPASYVGENSPFFGLFFFVLPLLFVGLFISAIFLYNRISARHASARVRGVVAVSEVVVYGAVYSVAFGLYVPDPYLSLFTWIFSPVLILLSTAFLTAKPKRTLVSALAASLLLASGLTIAPLATSNQSFPVPSTGINGQNCYVSTFVNETGFAYTMTNTVCNPTYGFIPSTVYYNFLFLLTILLVLAAAVVLLRKTP